VRIVKHGFLPKDVGFAVCHSQEEGNVAFPEFPSGNGDAEMTDSIALGDEHASRRAVLLGAVGVAVSVLPIPPLAASARAAADSHTGNRMQEVNQMTKITMKDGTDIYFKDWGTGKPITFSHGWPLSADAWDDQMMFLANQGYRVIAHDRRGHGRSGQPWRGNDMNTYADDLATLLDALDLKEVVMIGHSTGGGEVARYVGRHGTKRVAKVVLIGAVPPLMLKTVANPAGLPKDAFDEIRAGVSADRSQFFKDLSMPFYGYNRPGAKVSQGVRDSFWLQGMQVSIKGAFDCIQEFSETDSTEDLKKIDVPALIVHGDDDQIVPIAASALLSAKIVKGATLKVYPGAPHGLSHTHKDKLNADLLAFIRTPA
jgi:non-heme chloroperoxidase